MMLCGVMEIVFGVLDVFGFWDWKDVYEVCEVVMILFLCKFGCVLFCKVEVLEVCFVVLMKIVVFLLSYIRCFEESQVL